MSRVAILIILVAVCVGRAFVPAQAVKNRDAASAQTNSNTEVTK